MPEPKSSTGTKIGSPGSTDGSTTIALVHLLPSDLPDFISCLVHVNIGTFLLKIAHGIKEAINALLDHLGIVEWSDLAVFSVVDVKACTQLRTKSK